MPTSVLETLSNELAAAASSRRIGRRNLRKTLDAFERHLTEGSGNRAIAVHLCISGHTVKFHISSILAKLGAANRTEAVTLGVRKGLILL